MIVCGLDVSLKSTGWCVIDSSLDVKDSGIFEFSSANAERLLNDIVSYYGSGTHIAIEGYAFAAPGNRILQQAEAVGIIKHICGQRSLLYNTVHIQTWKKHNQFYGKKGTKKKNSDYCKAANEQFETFFDTTDEIDAYLIAKTYVEKQ